MEDDLLVAENVRCTVGDRVLFDELSLSLRPGDLVEIRGSNGSGKSTLLRCLVGLHEPDAGDIHRNVDSLYVGHRPGICGRMTPIESLRWLAGITNSNADTAFIGVALDRVGLDEARHDVCDSLSAGQQRRVALARLLVSAAPLWILDEPLTALDDDGRDLVGELLTQHRAIGGAAVCATHQTLPTAPGGTRTVTLGS
ncbi:MAG: cytochrome c biogenesis heme-transporting ATPase CcmA [Gammaproteobacteria bacterium]|nr:cytochrome c biogenesis heme-transporting ATPase CcmA [Gammaproteobacteria bacterium]MDE0444830.1 cytochrome c biogenesis heme-transporting ATPase CcmA [Gammaproteobacteria bacterium]